ncbi:unnamed protein product [Sphenostylis stenocarpa]|uniref:Uncharacterized protein n=1 Tax=Sphenostylis stenocarpa TaxID=92480 RepID=A0AA87B8Y4_9FABA|nr:unnamed protein product [Sphenostylis stenocarpa]
MIHLMQRTWFWSIKVNEFSSSTGIQEGWVWISGCVDFNGLCRGNEENLKLIFRFSHPSLPNPQKQLERNLQLHYTYLFLASILGAFD